MPFAAGLSEHPVAGEAVGEVTGQVLEALGPAPDLALLLVTGDYAGLLGDLAEVVRRVLSPTALVGCAAVSVLANGHEVEETPAVVLWAGRVGPVHPVHLGAGRPPADPPFEPSALILLGDPFSFPAEQAFADVAARWPGLPVVGGMASAARQPGASRLLIGGQVVSTGAVGVFLGPGVEVETVVSQGCKPIGRPYAVTRSEVNVVHELAGKPSIARLLEIAEKELSEQELAILNRGGLHVGRVIDEHKTDFERG
ncbi:MAG TPA: FIST N-terminal domain-containing protein, partial [Acidimicrobiales bacterium]|nr:FIST N-terminal domain-containing protein [Acidimicrobiales bacterium]